MLRSSTPWGLTHTVFLAAVPSVVKKHKSLHIPASAPSFYLSNFHITWLISLFFPEPSNLSSIFTT